MRSQLALVGLVGLIAACSPAVGVLDAEGDGGAGDAMAGDVAALDAFEGGGDSALVVDVLPAGDVAAEASADAAPDTLSCATDNDRDGHVSRACGGDDCDDANARVHPGQLPHCDPRLVDSDCNGTPDAMEEESRNDRCDDEAETRGMRFPAYTIACAATDTPPSCRSCRPGTNECVCWASGEMTSRACSRM